MAIGENITSASPTDIIVALGELGLWIQALGLFVVIWLIFNIITMFYNWKRRKLLGQLVAKLDTLEKKLEKLIEQTDHRLRQR